MKINKNLLLIKSIIATRSKYNKEGGLFIDMRITGQISILVIIYVWIFKSGNRQIKDNKMMADRYGCTATIIAFCSENSADMTIGRLFRRKSVVRQPLMLQQFSIRYIDWNRNC